MYHWKEPCAMALAGAVAGAVNGIFGAGGGMLLVPLLSFFCRMDEDSIFPASISIILPICVVSLLSHAWQTALPWADAVPYLLGSAIGGVIAGSLGGRIPTKWLHRGLGVLILYGGWRYLC